MMLPSFPRMVPNAVVGSSPDGLLAYGLYLF